MYGSSIGIIYGVCGVRVGLRVVCFELRALGT